MNAQWLRVKKKTPCVVCKHGDWCTYSPELGLAMCMRIESDRLSRNRMGGWLHKTGDGYIAPIYPVREAVKEKPRDLKTMWNQWERRTEHLHRDGFAQSLGVDTAALETIGCVWAVNAWGFQMKNEQGEMIGIRLRANNGKKWAVTGSKSGLFIPREKPERMIFITEGPTDCSAALTLGLFAIGRPSNLGCEDMVNGYIKIHQIKQVVRVSDNDGPGLMGADRLQKSLQVPSCKYIPLAKDIREFVNLGGDAEMVQSSIKDLVWNRP